MAFHNTAPKWAPAAIVSQLPPPAGGVASQGDGGYRPAILLAGHCRLGLARRLLRSPSRLWGFVTFNAYAHTPQLREVARGWLSENDTVEGNLAVRILGASGRMSDARLIFRTISRATCTRSDFKAGVWSIRQILGTGLASAGRSDWRRARVRYLRRVGRIFAEPYSDTVAGYYVHFLDVGLKRIANDRASHGGPLPISPGGIEYALGGLLRPTANPAARIRAAVELLPEIQRALRQWPRRSRAIRARALWDVELLTGPVLPYPVDPSGGHVRANLGFLRIWLAHNRGTPRTVWLLDSLAKAGFATENPADAATTFHALMSALRSKRDCGLCRNAARAFLNRAYPAMVPVLAARAEPLPGAMNPTPALAVGFNALFSYSYYAAFSRYVDYSRSLRWDAHAGRYVLEAPTATEAAPPGPRETTAKWPPGLIPVAPHPAAARARARGTLLALAAAGLLVAALLGFWVGRLVRGRRVKPPPPT